VDSTGIYGIDGLRVLKVPLPCGGTPIVLAVGNPQGLAIDATNVYWTDSAGLGADTTVYKVAKGGGQPMPLATLPYGPGGSAISVDATSVYVLGYASGDGPCSNSVRQCQPGVVMKVPTDGGAPIALATAQATPVWIAVDAANVYWANEGPTAYGPGDSMNQAAIMSTPLAGGAVSTLVSDLAAPGSLFVQGSRLYWSARASIMSMPTSGGTPATLVQHDFIPGGMTVDARSIYLVDGSGSIDVIPLTGGTATTLAAVPMFLSDQESIAVDSTSVYWNNTDKLLRVTLE